MDLNDCLNVLESQPSFEGLCTQICLCYSLPDTFSYSEIVNSLTTGLEKLSESFPWVVRQAVQEKMNGRTSFPSSPLLKVILVVITSVGPHLLLRALGIPGSSNLPRHFISHSLTPLG